MVLFVHKHIKFLLMLFSLTYNVGKQMKVLEFKPDDYYLKTIEKGPVTPFNDLLHTTKETSVCLRLMTRYRRSFIVVSNHIAKIIYYYVNGSNFIMIGFERSNGSADSNFGGRFMPICQPITPGKWLSLCVSVKFTDNEQLITSVFNGHICNKQRYPMDKQHWIYFKKTIFLNDM